MTRPSGDFKTNSLPRFIIFLFMGFLSLALLATSAQAADLDYDLYFRTPVGANSVGGKQITINNPGSRGNEFRLGNETAYGDASFTAHALRGSTKSAPFFNANLTFAYDPAMNSQYGDTTASGDRTQVIQAYVKGGNFDRHQMSYWAGKRYYRDASVAMNDFFYFAAMSGNGGGIEDLALSNGTLSVALLQFSDRTVSAGSTGLPAKQALDFRWKDFSLTDNDKLNFWMAEAVVAPGHGTDNAQSPAAAIEYEAATGTALGVRWNHSMGSSSNELALLYGTSIMENFELDNNGYSLVGSATSKKNRWRLVENYNSEINANWAVNAAAIVELADNGQSSKSKSHWYSVGVRPVYYFSDHFHLVSGFGYSMVGADSEVDSTGANPGDRTLMRLTVAPQIALGKGYYKRPVLRTYVTYSQWNDANKDTSNSQSLVKVSGAGSNSTTALNNKNDLIQVGVEGEIWF